MTRGDIYEVIEDSHDFSIYSARFMNEGDFDADELKVSYVAGRYWRDAAGYVMDFVKMLESFGAKTGVIEDWEWETNYYYFTVGEDFKRNYFSARFKELVKSVSEMTLDDFATKSQGKMVELLQDDFGDGIYYNGSFYDLDLFIREYLKEGVKYWIGNHVIGMYI